ncbi:MAG: glycosyltransferase [Spirochaetales bacterium]|nr:glycosyltransferase [Spirochaetales bacterium]
MKTSLFFLRQQQALTLISSENRRFEEEKLALRSKYKYDSGDFIILYIAEFIPRKDHEFFIRNIPELKKRIPSLKVIMPGRGVQLKEMKILAVNLGVDDIIWFSGYRKDINLLCAISDLYVTTSRQEEGKLILLFLV